MLETMHPPHPVNKEPPQLLRPRVGTWLTPRERGEVEMAAGALLGFVHRDTLQALRQDLAVTAKAGSTHQSLLVLGGAALAHGLDSVCRGSD